MKTVKSETPVFAMVLVLLVSAAHCAEQPYHNGDEVIAARNVELKVEARTVATARQGEVLVVEETRGDWLWVRRNESRGWVERNDILPRRPSAGAARGEALRGIVEQRLAERFDGGRKWAVLIGVNKYLDPAIPSLRYCVADTHLLSETLAEHCGYEARRILMLTDDQQEDHLKPLGINLRNQILEWLKKAEPGDTVLVFFAGHGILDAQGQGFLVPKDCEMAKMGLTALRIDNLRDMLNQCLATQKVLILDCCHAGGRRDMAPVGPSSQELGLAFRQASGLITLASCDRSELSLEWDEWNQGLFTYWLVQGLRGAADLDHDGLIDSYELHRYVMDQVSLTAQTLLNGRQTPKLLLGEDVTGVFALARVGSMPLPPVEPRPRPSPVPAGPATEPLKVIVQGNDCDVHLIETTGEPDTGTVECNGINRKRDVHVRRGQQVSVEIDGIGCWAFIPREMKASVKVAESGFNNRVFYTPLGPEGVPLIVRLSGDDSRLDIVETSDDPDSGRISWSADSIDQELSARKGQEVSISISGDDCQVFVPRSLRKNVKVEASGDDAKVTYKSTSGPAPPPDPEPVTPDGLRPLKVRVKGIDCDVRLEEVSTGEDTGILKIDGAEVKRDVRIRQGQPATVQLKGIQSWAFVPSTLRGSVRVIEGQGADCRVFYTPLGPEGLPLVLRINSDYAMIDFVQTSGESDTGRRLLNADNVSREFSVRNGQEVNIWINGRNCQISVPSSLRRYFKIGGPGEGTKILYKTDSGPASETPGAAAATAPRPLVSAAPPAPPSPPGAAAQPLKIEVDGPCAEVHLVETASGEDTGTVEISFPLAKREVRVRKGQAVTVELGGPCSTAFVPTALRDNVKTTSDGPGARVFYTPFGPGGPPLRVFLAGDGSKLRITETSGESDTGTVMTMFENASRDVKVRQGQFVEVWVAATNCELRISDSLRGKIEITDAGAGTKTVYE